MKIFKAISKEEWEIERYSNFAGVGNRLLALFVDTIVFIPILILLFGIELLFNINIPTEIGSILFIGYRIIFHFNKGATIGKKQTELRVEDNEGNKISFKQALTHELPLIISVFIDILISELNSSMITKTIANNSGDSISFTQPTSDISLYLTIISFLILLVDFLWIFTNKEKKALHDVLANTYCKKK